MCIDTYNIMIYGFPHLELIKTPFLAARVQWNLFSDTVLVHYGAFVCVILNY